MRETLTVTVHGNVNYVVVSLVGELDLSTVDKLTTHRYQVPGSDEELNLMEIAARHPLELDLSHLSFIDGGSLRAIMWMNEVSKESGFGGLKIKKRSSAFQLVVKTLQLEGRFPLPELATL